MNVAAAFFIVGFSCLVVAIYPFTIYPWSLILLQALIPRKPRVRANELVAPHLRCAICVCAYNEERVIERKVENLLALRARHPDLEILVYVDAASDRTAAILGAYAQQIQLHLGAERRGKTYGMNLLVSKAQAPILIFTDANVIMDMNCVEDFGRYFVDPEIGCVCGSLAYTNASDSTTAASGSAYWRFEQAIKLLEMETGSMMGADGSLFAIRRSLHRPPPEDIIDDMYVSLMILCHGFRVIQARDAIAYEESASSSREEFKRKIRIACQAFNVHRLIWPELRQLDRVTLYKYVSHKLIRWFTIYFLVLAALLLEAALVDSGLGWAAFATACFGVIVLVCGYGFSIKPFDQIADILLAFLGTGLGVWQSMRGRTYQTWTPSASIRKL